MIPAIMPESKIKATAAARLRGKRARIMKSTTGARMKASSTETNMTTKTSSPK